MPPDDTAALEAQISTLIATSGLSAHEAIVAVGISMARVLYGIQELHDKHAAYGACALLDDTMCAMWARFRESGMTRTLQ